MTFRHAIPRNFPFHRKPSDCKDDLRRTNLSRGENGCAGRGDPVRLWRRPRATTQKPTRRAVAVADLSENLSALSKSQHNKLGSSPYDPTVRFWRRLGSVCVWDCCLGYGISGKPDRHNSATTL